MCNLAKLSKYNLFINDSEGNLIIYNFLNGIRSLTKIDKNYIKIFTQLFLDSDINLNNNCERYTEIAKKLLDLGIIIYNDVDENMLYDMKYYNNIYNSNLILTILPTGECNLKCPYCFEAEKLFTRFAMTEEVQRALIRFVQRNIHNYTSLNVAWFGGEPLLEPQIIKHLSDNFIKICSTRYLPYYAEIVTNGYYLNLEMFDMLYKLKIYNFTITIDGFKEQHDKIKFTQDGLGTYDNIINNLINIRDNKQYKFAKIRIRVNMTKKFLEILDNFVLYINSLFSSDSRFSFQFIPVENFNKKENNDYFDNKNECFSKLLKNEIYVNNSGF